MFVAKAKFVPTDCDGWRQISIHSCCEAAAELRHESQPHLLFEVNARRLQITRTCKISVF